MTPTTDLCPVKDGGNAVRGGEGHQPGSPLSPATDAPASVQAVEPQQPGSLTLYHLSDELTSLLAVREEMAEGKEDTAEIDKAIAEYFEALPKKVDDVVHVYRTIESQIALATDEVARINAFRKRLASALDRIGKYCVSVLERIPQPKRGARKLEGNTAALVLKGNGGLQPLDIYDESLVPDEYCRITASMPLTTWQAIESGVEHIDFNTISVQRSVDNAAVRKALVTQCWFCQGGPEKAECGVCGGSGLHNVPGARLLDRGSHLEIK